MRKFWRKFIKQEDGQSMVEYALLAALIAVALIAFVVAMQEQIGAVFTTITAALQ